MKLEPPLLPVLLPPRLDLVELTRDELVYELMPLSDHSVGITPSLPLHPPTLQCRRLRSLITKGDIMCIECQTPAPSPSVMVRLFL